jgi:hypothetical protein
MERDYPVGHPAASDYNGEPYTPQGAHSRFDYPPGHPAHGGKNVGTLDTADGMRAAHNLQTQNLSELAAVGSLPPLRDDSTGDEIKLTAEQLAHVYAVRKGLRPALAAEISDRYRLEPDPEQSTESPAAPITAGEQAIAYVVAHGYTPERAKELIAKYGVPDVLTDKEHDAHR